MEKVEQIFTQYLNDEDKLVYPDFDSMWGRVEASMPDPGAQLKSVPAVAPRWRWVQHQKVAIISSLALLLVAAPVFAAVSSEWGGLFGARSGIQAALENGLGQSIGKSVTQDGVKLTIKAAVVDENQTLLLYSVSTEKKLADLMSFSTMEIKDGHGKVVEGQQSQIWDPASQTWNGYFRTDWAPDGLITDVQFTAKNLQSFSNVEHNLAFNSSSNKSKSFTINQDGIGKVKVQPFIQGDRMMLNSAITYSQLEVKEWAFPHLGVYRDNILVKELNTSVFGTPGGQGEFNNLQFYKQSDLEQGDLQYKLLYTREDQRIDKEWTYSLQLDKTKMLSGTVKYALNAPLEGSGGRLVVDEMVITPTLIRIKTSHALYADFPYLKYALDVNGTILNGWEKQVDSEHSSFDFDLPSDLKVTAETPIAFVAKHENLTHKDAKAPIILKDISEVEKTMTTTVGSYSVKWTYYKRDGNLYIQSECEDPSFGGINQTFMGDRKKPNSIPGKQVTVNFVGDGNNKAIDVYKNYQKNDAEIYIFWYYTENPSKEIRVDLKR